LDEFLDEFSEEFSKESAKANKTIIKRRYGIRQNNTEDSGSNSGGRRYSIKNSGEGSKT